MEEGPRAGRWREGYRVNMAVITDALCGDGMMRRSPGRSEVAEEGREHGRAKSSEGGVCTWP